MSRPSSRPDAAGLLALRRAIALAVATDPLTGPDRVAFRNVPSARGAVAAEAMALPLDAAGVEEVVGHTAVAVVAPRHAEPDAEQAVVMALVTRAQAGEADAFGELYDRYVDLVFRYIYYRVGARALAEDLTSETFLRALRRISSFTWQGRDVGAWFVTIARNLIADHYKSGRYRLEVATADMLDADQAEDGPEAAVLDSITNATLLDAVKELNPEQQECIVLRFLQGMSVAETALAMGKNEGAIKALQYRAVRALGRLLPADMVL
jgi:RNA polymerase sigma-70 factor (ECF subfamily)